MPDDTTLAAVVREHVIATCERCGWSRVRAAEALGISVKSIYNHLHRYEDQGFLAHDGTTWKRVERGSESRTPDANARTAANHGPTGGSQG